MLVMAYVVMAYVSYGLCSYGLCSYGLCSYGPTGLIEADTLVEPLHLVPLHASCKDINRRHGLASALDRPSATALDRPSGSGSA